MAVAESELLEREVQLQVLRDCLAAVGRDGPGRLVLLRGEAGIGKTTLARRFCDEQTPRARVLWGACEALFTPRALGPFADIAELAGHDVQRVVDEGGEPHEMAAAIDLEVRRSSPAIVVLEDLHWADDATLDVVRLIGRRLDGFRGLLIGTYRDDELDASSRLRVVVGELVGGSQVVRVDVPRLSPAAVAGVAEPLDIDGEELYRHTAGNPFFVSEVVAAGAATIPSTVRDAVLARAARLGAQARALLEAIAIATPSIEFAVLEAVAPEAVGALRECMDGGMVVPASQGVAFRHELARLVIESETPIDRRVALHRAAVDALLRTRDPERIVHHAEAAGDVDTVLQWAPEAARRAAERGAHRECAAFYERVVLLGHELARPERARLLLAYAHECVLTDQVQQAIAAYEEAIAIQRELADPTGEAEALEQLSNVLWCPGHVLEARDAALRAVELLEQGEPGRQLIMAYGRLAQLCMDAEETADAVEWGARALELAETLGESQFTPHLLASVGISRLLAGDEAGQSMLDRSLALATERRLHNDAARALTMRTWIALRRREYARTLELLEPAIAFAGEHGSELFRVYLLARKAQTEFELGRWSDAVETVSHVLRENTRSRVPRIMGLTLLARVRARRGDPEVSPLLDEARELAGRGAELQADVPVAAACAEVCWLAGDRDGVERATAGVLALARERESAWAISELLLWRGRAGIRDDWAVELDPPHSLEQAGDWSGAAAAWRELGATYDAAIALAGAGDARSLRQAFDELRALGATRAGAVVAQMMRERGVPVPRGPYRRASANAGGLTTREIEVLQLLCAGARNSDIARDLVMSEKTVGHHVSAILRKLEVRNRTEATAEAMKLGLIPN